ncbi:PAS domain-containing sensor histidine kinase [Massilia sp. 9096]|uniref:PAS domain-containing sensor histidine kinase n=1 Tax=Massilia sp. 9096 TaxID=1500894 RepID=UPI0009DD26C4|nr:PAS domain-containing sensor histidine kinase [Massilia sp. 9096]
MIRNCPVPESAQAALATAEAFRTIAELSGDIAFILDCATGLPVYVSPNVDALLGYGSADIQQQLINQEAGPLAALCAGLPARLRRFAEGDGSRLRVTRAFEVRRPDGRTVPLEVISTLVLDASGQAAALVGLVRDQSAQRARALEQKRFASMLNHEFRTPLSTIDGAIQRLEATAAAANADEPTRQRYRKIAVATDRLIGMLDDYLSPDRMAELGRERQANTVSPRLLLEEVVAQARVAGRPVTFDAADLPAALRCEPAGLRLALKLILDNALRYSPPHTPLTVSGVPIAGGVELSLRDMGPGVPPEDAERIFEKGYRGANAAGLPGNGLGLYMARSVVEVHGGSLACVASVQGGAQFRMWLPVQLEAAKNLASNQTNSDNRDEARDRHPTMTTPGQ